ncbi:MAG: hypothetical protein AAB348_03355 [Patescibacteria group bacterium]
MLSNFNFDEENLIAGDDEDADEKVGTDEKTDGGDDKEDEDETI